MRMAGSADRRFVLFRRRRRRAGRTRNRLGVLRIVQPLAKALDALGDVAHQVRDLAATTEQEQRDDCQNKNVPNAEATHETLLLPRLNAPKWLARRKAVLLKDPSGG